MYLEVTTRFLELWVQQLFRIMGTTVEPDDTPPSAISNLTALTGTGEGEINLAWTAPGDDGTSEDIINGKYRIKYSTDSSVSWTAPYSLEWSTDTSPGNPEMKIATGLIPGATYYFRVWTRDEAPDNWSELSNGATSWANIIPPSAITNLSALAGWRRVALNWTAPGDDGTKGAISDGQYWVKYSTVGAITDDTKWNSATYEVKWPTNTYPGSNQTKVITGLTNGTTYWFAIKTKDECPDNWSVLDTGPEPNVYPKDNPPAAFGLTSPSNNIIVTTNTPTFVWESAFDPDAVYGDTVTYTISYSTDNFVTEISSQGLTTNEFTPLSPLIEDATYWWKVKAIDLDGASTMSIEQDWRFWVNADDQPPGVFDLASPQDASISTTATPTFTWNPTTDPDFCDSVSYELHYSTYANFSVYTSSCGLITSTCTVAENLIENATYWWKVKAIGTTGAYAWSDSTRTLRINATDEPPEDPVLSSPYDTDVVSTDTPTLSWNEADDPDPGDTVTYTVTYSSYSDFSALVSSAALTISSYTVQAALNENATYWWFVEAVGSGGASGWSSTWTFHVNAIDKAPSVFSLVSPPNSNEISTVSPFLKWNSSTDPDPGDTITYTVFLSTDAFISTMTVKTGIQVTQWTITPPLSQQTTYYWKVEAVGSGGLGRMCTEQDWWFFVRDVTPPAKISQVSVWDNPTDTGGKIIVSWTEGNEIDIKGCRVYYAFTQFTSTASATYFSDSPALDADASSCTVTGLENNKNYYFAVIAIDNTGNPSPLSECAGPVCAINNYVSSGNETIVSDFSPDTPGYGCVTVDPGTNYGIYIDVIEPAEDKQNDIDDANANALLDPNIVASTVEDLKDTGVEFRSSQDLTADVTIKIRYPSTIVDPEESYLRIFRLDEDNNKWVLVNEKEGKQHVDVDRNIVITRVSGFSIYRIMGVVYAASNLDNVIVYPNPFKPTDGESKTGTWGQGIFFGNLTKGAEIKIFTISGDFVDSFEKTDSYSGRYQWEVGDNLASGIYIYLITNPDDKTDKASGKFAIIK